MQRAQEEHPRGSASMESVRKPETIVVGRLALHVPHISGKVRALGRAHRTAARARGKAAGAAELPRLTAKFRLASPL